MEEPGRQCVGPRDLAESTTLKKASNSRSLHDAFHGQHVEQALEHPVREP